MTGLRAPFPWFGGSDFGAGRQASEERVSHASLNREPDPSGPGLGLGPASDGARPESIFHAEVFVVVGRGHDDGRPVTFYAPLCGGPIRPASLHSSPTAPSAQPSASAPVSAWAPSSHEAGR